MKSSVSYIIIAILFFSSCKENTNTVSNNNEGVKRTALEKNSLKSKLTFHAAFDDSETANFAIGDKNLYTTLNRKVLDSTKKGIHKEGVTIEGTKGKYGGALQFLDKTKGTVFYKSKGNIAYSETDWSGSISFWLSLNPDKDLKPGYCDPIQITDSGYNDAGIWVDFTKTLPRQFRLGVIGDREAWNPNPEGPDNENPIFLKQLITAKNAPFGNDKWTHIVINFSNLNTRKGAIELFVNGKNSGTSMVTEPFTWDCEKSNILLGLSYIGLMDDLSIYNKPLTPAEIDILYNLENGVKSIM